MHLVAIKETVLFDNLITDVTVWSQRTARSARDYRLLNLPNKGVNGESDESKDNNSVESLSK